MPGAAAGGVASAVGRGIACPRDRLGEFVVAELAHVGGHEVRGQSRCKFGQPAQVPEQSRGILTTREIAGVNDQTLQLPTGLDRRRSTRGRVGRNAAFRPKQ